MKRPNQSTLIRLAALLLTVSASSCVAPPPPTAYQPDVARRLDRISHDRPVTPLPDIGARVWEIY